MAGPNAINNLVDLGFSGHDPSPFPRSGHQQYVDYYGPFENSNPHGRADRYPSRQALGNATIPSGDGMA